MTTSGPPHASSWAEPPEFYADENVTTKSVVRLLRRPGYAVHTPAELYGTKEQASGAEDTDWLERVGARGWVVLSRDEKIFERPHEFAAYLAAKVHVFLLPGEATREQLCNLVATNLDRICAEASGRRPGVWRIRTSGLRKL